MKKSVSVIILVICLVVAVRQVAAQETTVSTHATHLETALQEAEQKLKKGLFQQAYSQGLEVFQQGVQQGDRAIMAQAAYHLGIASQYLLRMDHAFNWFKKAAQAFQGMEPADLQGVALSLIRAGFVAVLSSKESKESAIGYLEQGKILASQLSDYDQALVLGEYHFRMGLTDNLHGRFDKAGTHLRQSMNCWTKYPEKQADVVRNLAENERNNFSSIPDEDERLVHVQSIYEQSIDLALQSGNGSLEARMRLAYSQFLFETSKPINIKDLNQRYQHVLSLYQKDENPSGMAEVSAAFGRLHQRMGDFDNAISSFQLAADVYKELEEWPKWKQSIKKIAEISSETGRFLHYSKTQSILHDDKDNNETSGILSQLNHDIDQIFIAFDKYIKGDPFGTIKVYEDASGEGSVREPSPFAIQSQLLALIGRQGMGGPLPSSEKLETLFQSIDKVASPINRSAAWNNLIVGLSRPMLSPSTYDVIQKALDKGMRLDRQRAAWMDLGQKMRHMADASCYQAVPDHEFKSINQGQATSILTKYQESFQWFQQLEADPEIAKTIYQMGICHGLLQNRAKSVEVLQTARRMFKEMGMHKDYVFANNHIALNLRVMSRSANHKEIMAIYQENLDYFVEQGLVPFIWRTRYQLGRMHIADKKFSEARDQLSEAISAIRHGQESLADHSSQWVDDFLASAEPTQEIEVYHALMEVYDNMGQSEALFEVIEQAKAQILADRLKKNNFSLQARQSFSWKTVKNRLKPNQGILSYYVAEDRIYILAGTHATDNLVVARAFRVPVIQLVDKILEHIKTPPKSNNDVSFQTTAHNLYDKLLPDEIRTQLQAANEWIVSPSGRLHHLPFEVLKNNAGHYLVEDVAFTYTPSLGVWGMLGTRPETVSRPDGILMVGALSGNLSQSQTDSLTDMLRKHLPDGLRLTKISTESTMPQDNNLTENILKSIQGHKTVIFLSHGLFQTDKPLESHLFFNDHSKLSAMDLYQRFPQGSPNAPQFVMLGACQVGDTAVRPGDEPLGLPRAWMQMGVESILASLWDTPSDVVIRFLTILAEQGFQPETLGRTIQQVKKEMIGSHFHPYYWASFLLMGRN